MYRNAFSPPRIVAEKTIKYANFGVIHFNFSIFPFFNFFIEHKLVVLGMKIMDNNSMNFYCIKFYSFLFDLRFFEKFMLVYDFICSKSVQHKSSLYV